MEKVDDLTTIWEINATFLSFSLVLRYCLKWSCWDLHLFLAGLLHLSKWGRNGAQHGLTYQVWFRIWDLIYVIWPSRIWWSGKVYALHQLRWYAWVYTLSWGQPPIYSLMTYQQQMGKKIKKDTRNICGCPKKRLEDPIFRQALGPSLCWGLLKLTNLVVFLWVACCWDGHFWFHKVQHCHLSSVESPPDITAMKHRTTWCS